MAPLPRPHRVRLRFKMQEGKHYGVKHHGGMEHPSEDGAPTGGGSATEYGAPMGGGSITGVRSTTGWSTTGRSNTHKRTGYPQRGCLQGEEHSTRMGHPQLRGIHRGHQRSGLWRSHWGGPFPSCHLLAVPRAYLCCLWCWPQAGPPSDCGVPAECLGRKVHRSRTEACRAQPQHGRREGLPQTRGAKTLSLAERPPPRGQLGGSMASPCAWISRCP